MAVEVSPKDAANWLLQTSLPSQNNAREGNVYDRYPYIWDMIQQHPDNQPVGGSGGYRLKHEPPATNQWLNQQLGPTLQHEWGFYTPIS